MTSPDGPAASVNVRHSLASVGDMSYTAWAEDVARSLLEEPLPRRWAHTQGVAATARGLAPVLGPDADLVTAAAWLHDIGYAPDVAATGFHPLDGARHLRDAEGSERDAVPAGRPPLVRDQRGRSSVGWPASWPRSSGPLAVTWPMR